MAEKYPQTGEVKMTTQIYVPIHIYTEVAKIMHAAVAEADKLIAAEKARIEELNKK